QDENQTFSLAKEMVQMVDDAIGNWIQSGILGLTYEGFGSQWWTRTSLSREPRRWQETSVPLLAYLHEWFNSKHIVQQWNWKLDQVRQALQACEQFLIRGKMGMFQQIG